MPQIAIETLAHDGSFNAWLAAPEPRPPQPTSAMRTVSLGEIAPCAKRSMASELSSALPATALEELFKKFRRETTRGFCELCNSFMIV